MRAKGRAFKKKDLIGDWTKLLSVIFTADPSDFLLFICWFILLPSEQFGNSTRLDTVVRNFCQIQCTCSIRGNLFSRSHCLQACSRFFFSYQVFVCGLEGQLVVVVPARPLSATAPASYFSNYTDWLHNTETDWKRFGRELFKMFPLLEFPFLQLHSLNKHTQTRESLKTCICLSSVSVNSTVDSFFFFWCTLFKEATRLQVASLLHWHCCSETHEKPLLPNNEGL